MFRKLLIANRGEIACRVIRACNELGIRTVAVASEADAHGKHARLADELRLIGPAPSRESYLVVERILDAARATGAEAIHPGYGFLSESQVLRDACDAAGIVFVGPPSRAMAVMGEKTAARRAMQAAGVPVVPGTVEPLRDAAEAHAVAERIGYPIMLKAASGGGGKGMRLVTDRAQLTEAFESCVREATSAFSDGSVYLEKAILRPRHIEVQVMADRVEHGHVIHLGQRECSVQRRHQKVIEEALPANLSVETRRAMGEVAVTGARAIGYEGAGTFEFLCDAQENFYFLEMNTRLQVEHPVTEEVTGLDLVRLQIAVAAGRPLPVTQADVAWHGHALECRLYAEDPYNGFLPSPGRLWRYRPPSGPGVRVDDGVSEGDVVTPHYDPMVAKLITHATTREDAIARMKAALAELRLGGIRSNREFLVTLLDHPDFVAGRYSTAMIPEMGAVTEPALTAEERVLLATTAALTLHRSAGSRPASATVAPSGWRTAARGEGLRRAESWS